MKVKTIEPPRAFVVGRKAKISIKDCAHIQLEPNEQVTFQTGTGAEMDVARKSWGFYATPSLNGRLASFNLRAVLVASEDDKYYVFAVEKGKEADFQAYLTLEGHRIVHWLDTLKELQALEQKLVAR